MCNDFIERPKTEKEYTQQELDGTSPQVSKLFIGIKFQLGPVKEVGPNGCQIEDIIDILIKRLEGFQAGSYKCRENALVIIKLEEAIHWLNHRTAKREERGVEGTNQA